MTRAPSSSDSVARSRPRVVVIAPVHRYDDVRVFQKEAKTLARHGYEVRLLAKSPAPVEEAGVTVIPVPEAAWRGARFAKLPLVLARAIAQRGDVYHLHNPDTLPLAVALRLLGKKVVYDTHEDFSHRLLARRWIPRPLRPALAWGVAGAEWLVSRFVNLAIATQASVCNRLGPRTLLLQNPPIVSGPLVEQALARAPALERQTDLFRLVYVGGITQPRGLFAMLDALAIANESVPCRLWLIGPFLEGDRPQAEDHPAWRFVDYLGQLPQVEAFAHIARADAGLATLLDVGGHRFIHPNKLFEYQVFGTPFIASNFASWQEIMSGIDAGLFVDPGNPAAIAEAIVRLARNPEMRRSLGQAGRAFVGAYNWEVESRKLLSAYEALIGSSQAREHAEDRASAGQDRMAARIGGGQ